MSQHHFPVGPKGVVIPMKHTDHMLRAKKNLATPKAAPVKAAGLGTPGRRRSPRYPSDDMLPASIVVQTLNANPVVVRSHSHRIEIAPEDEPRNDAMPWTKDKFSYYIMIKVISQTLSKALQLVDKNLQSNKFQLLNSDIDSIGIAEAELGRLLKMMHTESMRLQQSKKSKHHDDEDFDASRLRHASIIPISMFSLTTFSNQMNPALRKQFFSAVVDLQKSDESTSMVYPNHLDWRFTLDQQDPEEKVPASESVLKRRQEYSTFLSDVYYHCLHKYVWPSKRNDIVNVEMKEFILRTVIEKEMIIGAQLAKIWKEGGVVVDLSTFKTNAVEFKDVISPKMAKLLEMYHP